MTLLRFGSFELDAKRFELRKAGIPVTVQPKVLDLIFYLARHRGRVVGKEELLHSVWGEVVVTEASLSQAVSLARKALDDSVETQLVIRTVRGKGFHFVAQAVQLSDSGQSAAVRVGQKATPPPGVISAEPRFEPLSTRVSVATSAETHRDEGPRSEKIMPRLQLFVLLHCDDPRAGAARYDLTDIDEVRIGRGSSRHAERNTKSITRKLELSLPGHSLSRDHARVVRTGEGWLLVDSGSKNGCYLNGERVERAELGVGDIFECGRTLMCLANHETTPSAPLESEWAQQREHPLPSLLPELVNQSGVFVRMARSKLPLLLFGPVGSGKAHAASVMHRLSGQPGPFVVVDCAALVTGHVHEQLFGGSYPGSFQTAASGTLLLEHIESLPPEVQPGVLSAIDEGHILPLGASPERSDVRVLAATTLTPSELSASGRLRPELWGRLSGYAWGLPALAARYEDIGALLGEFMRQLDVSLAIEPSAARRLFRYQWPGNLDELLGCLRVVSTLAGPGPISSAHLPDHLRRVAPGLIQR